MPGQRLHCRLPCTPACAAVTGHAVGGEPSANKHPSNGCIQLLETCENMRRVQQSRVRLCLDNAELLARLVLVCVQLQLAGLAPASCVLPLLQQAACDIEQLLSRAQVASANCKLGTVSQRKAYAPAVLNSFVAMMVRRTTGAEQSIPADKSARVARPIAWHTLGARWNAQSSHQLNPNTRTAQVHVQHGSEPRVRPTCSSAGLFSLACLPLESMCLRSCSRIGSCNRAGSHITLPVNSQCSM